MSQENIDDYLLLLRSQDWEKYLRIAMHIAKSDMGRILCKCPEFNRVMAETKPNNCEFPNFPKQIDSPYKSIEDQKSAFIYFEIGTKFKSLTFYLIIKVNKDTITKNDIDIISLGTNQIENTLEGLSENLKLEETNNKLSKQKNEIDLLLDSFGHMTLILDEEARMLDIFGKRDLILDSVNEMRGKRVYDYPELAHISQELRTKIKKHKKDLHIFSINFTLDKNGNREWFQAKLKPYIAQNNKIHFLTFILNITDQVLANKRINDTNNLLTETGKLAKVGAWKLDIKDKKVFCSSVTKKMLGIKNEELTINDSLIYFNNQASKIKIYKLIRNTLLNKKSHTAEFKIKTNFNTPIWVNIKVNAKFENGALDKLYGSIQDITSFKQIENELITEQNRLSYIIEGSDLGAWEWNTITDEAIHNDKWAKILGYEPSEILPIDAEKWEKLIHPDDVKKYNSEMAKHLRGETEFYQSEIRLKAKNGDYKWILDRGKVISYDKNGAPEKVYGTHRDITKEKNTEVKLKDNLKRFKTIFDFSPVGMVLVDYYSGNFIEVNNTTLRLTGYSKEEFLKLGLWDLAYNKKTTEDQKKMKILAQNGIFHPYEKELVRKNGDSFIGLLQGKLFTSTEGKKRVLSIITDITKDKKTAAELRQKTLQAKRANQAKTEFLANMSHEMKTPLNGIIGFSDLITNSNLSETQSMYMHTIKSSAQTLKGLISDVLDFSKIEAGKLALNITPVSLEQLTREVVHVVQHLAFEKGLLFILDLPVQLPEIVYIDQLKTKQILINLINNALKFTDEGYVKLSLQIRELNDKSLSIEFAVIDSGTGIKKENIHKILEAFTQEDSSINRQKGGTGLGLAISNKFINLMDSKLIVESELNHGSKFSFNLSVRHNRKLTHEIKLEKNINFINHNLNPELIASIKKQISLYNSQIKDPKNLVLIDYSEIYSDEVIKHLIKEHGAENLILLLNSNVSENIIDNLQVMKVNNFIYQPFLPVDFVEMVNYYLKSNRNKVPNNVEKIEKEYLGINLLIAEDNTVNMRLLTTYINNLYDGVNIFKAKDGKEAYEIFKEHNIDLLITDIQMPGLNGFVLTKKIKRLQKGKNTPVIAITAGQVENTEEVSKKAGINLNIAKPILQKDLYQKLKPFIKKAQGQKEYISLNLDYLKEILGDEPKVMKEFLTSTLESINESKSNISSEISSNNYKNLAKSYHKIKGTLLYLNLENLANYAQDLQLLAEKENPIATSQGNHFIHLIEKLISTLKNKASKL